MDAERWHKLTFAEQLGNVGSEYDRALSWKRKNQMQYFDKAFARTLEFLDLTIIDPRWRNHRLKELLRLREQVGELMYNDTVDLSRYFLYFAIAARTKQGS